MSAAPLASENSDDDPLFRTSYLHHCVERWQAGDAQAADELFRAVAGRLEHLARRMLRGYPNVRGWADTGDVVNGAAIRLLNTLRRMQPPSTRDFFNLAANHIRCELLDLARAARRRERAHGQQPEDSSAVLASVPQAVTIPADEMELWSRFHEAVEQLPTEKREVFSLAFYHGWKQVQMAELLGVDERTVRRRWHDACQELNRRVGGELPSA